MSNNFYAPHRLSSGGDPNIKPVLIFLALVALIWALVRTYLSHVSVF